MAAPAWKVAADVAEGYVSLNPVVLKKYERHEVDALLKELEKLTRDMRSQVVPTDDADASATRSRKLLRLSQANVVLQAWRMRMPK
jgi:cell wall assembly regulator SMI1